MNKKKKSEGDRVAIYARYSSENQRDESIEAQLDAINPYCEWNGFQVVKVYTDRAKSATSDQRPAFLQMIDDSSQGLFDFVVVHKLDRFSRDKYDSVIYKRKLLGNGVRVLSVTENLDGSPESKVMESLFESMAEYYSENLAREVMKGLNINAKKAQHTGGIPPLGYDVDPTTKKLVVNETEAIAVREIFRLYNDGYGYLKIIEALNARSFKTKKGQPFGKNSLHDIIVNEKYSGVYTYNRAASKGFHGVRNNHESKDDEDIIRVEGGVPAIISKEDFEKAQHRMIENRCRPGAYNAKENYLLSGLVFCGECGHAMTGNMRHTGNRDAKYVSYKCSYRQSGKSCDNKEIHKQHLEQFVLSEMQRLIFNDSAIPKLVSQLNEYQKKKAAQGNSDAEIIKAQIADIEKQIGNIVNAIAGGFSQPEFQQKASELGEQKSALQMQLAELATPSTASEVTKDTLRSLLSMFRRFVAEQNIPECKKFIQSFVDRVIVFHDHVEVVFKVNAIPGQDDGFTIRSTKGVKEIKKKFRAA